MNSKFAKNAFAAIALAGMIYCVVVYFYIQAMLVPTLPEPTEIIKNLGGLTLPFILLACVYHVFLLVRALNALGDRIKNIFIHSLYIVLIILSGISLLSDVTLLSDIGKEYRLLDVSEQWLILYGCSGLHIAVIVYGTVFSIKNKPSGKRFFEEIRNGNDAMFLSIFQIGFICGLLGIIGIIFSMSGIMGTVITEKFETAYMFLLAILALLPATVYIAYWAVRNKNKPISDWFDEKQQSDTAVSAMLTLASAFPLSVIFIILSVCIVALPASFWVSLLLFTQLVIFTGSVIWRSRLS